MNAILKKIAILSLVGIMQVSYGGMVHASTQLAVPLASQQFYSEYDHRNNANNPDQERQARERRQHDQDRMERERRQREHDERLREENERHDREMRRREHEREREWHERQHRERERHENELNIIAALLIIGAIIEAND